MRDIADCQFQIADLSNWETVMRELSEIGNWKSELTSWNR
jgi:hypothetical protein